MRWFGALLFCFFLAWWGIAGAESTTSFDETSLYEDAMQALTEGRIGDAKKILADLLVKEPRHAGAWLDLAILYCAAGDAAAAEDLFVEIERRFSPPLPILEVIAHQRRLGCSGWQAKSSLTTRLGRGFESNVNQGARSPNFSIGSGGSQIDLVLLPAYRPRSDQFTTLFGELVRDLSSTGTFGVLQFQSRNYDQLSQFNTVSLFIGAEQPWRAGLWRGRFAGSTGLMMLDGETYIKQSQLQFEIVPHSILPPGWQLGLTGSWSYMTYPTLNGFDAHGWETRGTVGYRGAESWWQASFGSVQDRQLGDRPGGDRSGPFVSVQGRMLLGNRVQGELGWQLQRWQGERAYFPGVIDVRREQETQIFRMAVIFPLNNHHAVHFELKDVRSRDNIPIFEYLDRVLQLSWQWQPSS